ncbi:zinc finger and BTB domain-containing protein 16 [Stegastes partitus]|uniref:Zinc finger and BTB domain-containing protein 32 n=1 Tax=Stegastes partitus TaxID=144197 RepID=A0A9Y4MV81_9TELE|nr:PREDICTED: zinc finger and BTB domain-containing protein 32 [Stegastes partitus]XP_008283212.1 PREDICTED: zinc finger and BTB domain-containing protein 32 [Stegastes partitus]
MIRIDNTQYFHFLQQADALRRSGTLCDAIISVKSQTFRAHRLVLACASRTLAQQLAHGDVDSPVHCALEYFSPHTFQQVLDFTYTESLEVSPDDLRLLLRAARLLEMQLLEDQCRKRLDALDYKAGEEDESGENTDVKEEKEERDQMKRPVHEDKLQETCSPVEKAQAAVDNPPDSDKNHNSPQSPRRKPRLSPTSYTRDSVISRPTSSSSSFSPPWTFSANMWDSVTTLRRIAQNYSNLIAAHPLPSPNQSSVPYPFSLSTPHMLPLLGPHFQTPGQNSVMGYSGFHPRYTQNLYAGSTRMGSIIKQGLLKRKRPNQRVFTGTSVQTGEPSYPEAAKASTERVKGCQHCSAALLDDPVLRESASTQLGKACAGCRFCGRGDAVQRESETRGDPRGEKPYQCQHCPKKFSLKHQLDTHHRVHTGEKPFECRICGQRSRDYSAMIKHLRTHGGAAPYRCTVCLEFCSSLVAMQRHVKTHAVQDFPPDWSINSTYLYISHI